MSLRWPDSACILWMVLISAEVILHIIRHHLLIRISLASPGNQDMFYDAHTTQHNGILYKWGLDIPNYPIQTTHRFLYSSEHTLVMWAAIK
jgi:hypothetical protein